MESNAVLKAFQQGWVVPSREPIYEWARKNVYLHESYAIPGPFHVEKSLYLKKPFEVLQDPDVREVTVYKAVQTGGSLLSELFVAWIVDNYPSPTMWNFQTDEDAQEAAETRINPLFDQCPPIKRRLPLERHKRTKRKILWNNKTWLLMQGAGIKNLQGKSVRILVNDEVWMWTPGHHSQSYKRTTAFSETCKILNISQGGLESDEMDTAYKAGSQEDWGFRCPDCKTLQPYVWGQMKYDDNEITHPSTWNFPELAKTIRYECASCKRPFKDNHTERRQLNDSGEYVVKNPGAPIEKRSFRWNAMASSAIRWSLLVEEWIHANHMLKNGSTLAMQEFIQKRLAEAWEDRGENEAVEIQSDYSLGDVWDKEKTRFLTIDVQKDHFWAVCRGWAIDGESRLVWEGKLLTFEEIHEKQREYAVTPKRVVIDSGFRATDVYEQCIKYGWTAFKGEDRDYFPHKLPNGKTVRRIYSPPQRGDPGIGTFEQGKRNCPLILWSNPTTKDFLQRLKTGRGPKWGLPKNISAEYLYQIDSEAKRLRHNKITGREIWEWVRIGKRPNHQWDNECQQVVASVIDGLLAKTSSEE